MSRLTSCSTGIQRPRHRDPRSLFHDFHVRRSGLIIALGAGMYAWGSAGWFVHWDVKHIRSGRCRGAPVPSIESNDKVFFVFSVRLCRSPAEVCTTAYCKQLVSRNRKSCRVSESLRDGQTRAARAVISHHDSDVSQRPRRVRQRHGLRWKPISQSHSRRSERRREELPQEHVSNLIVRRKMLTIRNAFSTRASIMWTSEKATGFCAPTSDLLSIPEKASRCGRLFSLRISPAARCSELG